MDPYRQPAETSRPGWPPTPPTTTAGRVTGGRVPPEQQGGAPFHWSGTEPRPETTPAVHSDPPSHRHPRVPEQRPPVDPPTVPTLVAPRQAPALPPPEVRAAFWLWMTAVAIGLVVALVTLVNTRAIVERELQFAGDAGAGIGPAGSILTGTVVTVVLVGVISVLLHVVFAVLMRRGHGWARIALSVLGALAVASAVYRIATESTIRATAVGGTVADSLSLVLAPLQALLLIAAVVLFFRPRANHYYRTESVRREVSRARRAMTR